MRSIAHVSLSVLLLAATPADATTQLATAPHFLKLADRERIVLFSEGAVAGAMAETRADGSIEVRVPRVAVTQALAGRTFEDIAPDGGKTTVTVEADAQGDARIRIAAARPVTRVHAFATRKPARLTIDLLHGKGATSETPAAAAKADVAPAARAAAKGSGESTAAGPAVAGAKDETAVAVPTSPATVAAGAAAVTAKADDPPRGTAATAPSKSAASTVASSAAPSSTVATSAAPSSTARTPGTASTSSTSGATASSKASAAATKPAGVTLAAAKRSTTTTTTTTVAEIVGPPRPPTGATTVDRPTSESAPSAVREQTLICRWRRVDGVAYCAPDPKGGPYVADLGTSNLAGLVDRARSGPTLRPLAGRGAAETYLNADVALLRAASAGWLLPAVASYEQALRAYPGFADAARARANVALIYHALGFAPELQRLTRAQNDPVAPFAGVLLADLWRDKSEKHDPAPLIATGRAAGGITACLAERVAASRAADEGRSDAFPAAFTTLAQVCPRTIVEDSETAWLRARAMVLAGEAARAADALAALESELPRRERGLLLADIARAHEAAGNVAGARRAEERLAAGKHGRRAARAARVSLAARDAAAGDVAALDGRFADLPMEDALQTRERADLVAVGELLRAGNEIAALGMISERDVDANELALGEQLLLARALRRVGLLEQARHTLANAAASTTKRLPDEYYEELGAQALAKDDAVAALAAAEEWQAARGGEAPAGAVALRARGRAAKGDARGATETLDRELRALDPLLARAVAVELASALLSADPALARHLAQDALADTALPPLEPALEAEALHALGEAAEATQDTATARDAFTRLAREHAGEAAAAGAAYRASRLATTADDAVPATGDASASARPPAAAAPIDDDPLSRRVAAVGQLYAEVVSGMAQQGGRP